MSNIQNIDAFYKDDLLDGGNVEAELIESNGKDLDFDQINEENITYSRYGGSATQHQQQS